MNIISQDDFIKRCKQAKYGREQLEKLRQKIEDMSQEEFDELIETSEKRYDNDNDTEEKQEFEVITDPVELDFINKMTKLNKQQTFNVDDIIYHMNGVDPIRIQDELVKKTGQYLSIEEIIKIMKGE